MLLLLLLLLLLAAAVLPPVSYIYINLKFYIEKTYVERTASITLKTLT